jgi:hypothetical protein
MKNQIVISRYNENIRYLLNYSHISIVYNKGNNDIPLNFNYINLPNIGRESHTYLYHIIKNYDNLADKTLFIQGNIKDHKLYPLNNYLDNKNLFVGNKSIHPIIFLKKNINHKGKYLNELYNKDLKKSKYTPYEWINLIGIDITHINKFEMVWGANFSISKDLIHKKPKIFYENIIKYLEYDKNPEEGHYFERAWFLIFNNSIFNKKKIILYDFFNINNDKIIDKYKSILDLDYIQEIHLWTTNIIDKNIKIKYINKNNYIPIYPDIVETSFSFNINNNLNLLLNLKNKKYDFFFGIDSNYIKIIDYNSLEIIRTLKIDNNLENYIICWKNNNLKLIYNNNILFSILIDDDIELIDINVKSKNKTIINYNTISDLNIFNMINCNNYINKNFYRNNFENYYVKDLTEFILNH